jgi:small multidrug resistance pump
MSAVARDRKQHMHYAYLVIAILGEVVATSALKATDGFTKLWPSVVVVIGYATALLFLSLTIRTMPVGIAYAIWAGVGTVFIVIAGYVLYRQTLDLPALIGIGLIVLGVIVINVLSKSVTH